MRSISGASAKTARMSAIAWMMPERRVLAPAWMFAPDRAMTPVTGIPPNRALAMLPSPCPMSS